ncbi:MAG: thioesterase [Hyphomicrobiales bacterium]|nr:thioesterase [Hyphomicrobiales bacterium]
MSGWWLAGVGNEDDLAPRAGMEAIVTSLPLVCIPYAGGSSACYERWHKHANGTFSLVPFDLAGHGRRALEPVATTVPEVVNDLVEQVHSVALTGNYALFGHSFGALLSYELTLRLAEYGYPSPVHVFVSGANPPHRLRRSKRHELSEEQLLRFVEERGMVPPSLLRSAEARDFFLRILRADFRAIETYEWIDNGPLPCPLAAFVAAEDPAIDAHVVHEWERYSSGPAEIRWLAGATGHMYLDSHAEPILAAIRARLGVETALEARG